MRVRAIPPSLKRQARCASGLNGFSSTPPPEPNAGGYTGNCQAFVEVAPRRAKPGWGRSPLPTFWRSFPAGPGVNKVGI